MALHKEIRQEDGVITNYHRILYVQTTVNSHNSVAVLSYVDDVARNSEKEDILVQPYQKAKTYETAAYYENMTVEAAYELLKTLPEFIGAEDV